MPPGIRCGVETGRDLHPLAARRRSPLKHASLGSAEEIVESPDELNRLGPARFREDIQ